MRTRSGNGACENYARAFGYCLSGLREGSSDGFRRAPQQSTERACDSRGRFVEGLVMTDGYRRINHISLWTPPRLVPDSQTMSG
jgi:hypothetical protein